MIRDAWQAWAWDWPTFLWVLWFPTYFGVLEYLTSGTSPIVAWRGNMLTDHWRPLIQEVDVTWFIGVGLYLALFFWGFKHFFIDGVDFAKIFGRR